MLGSLWPFVYVFPKAHSDLRHNRHTGRYVIKEKMTLASNQDFDRTSLSQTAQRMLELRDAVFAEWEQRVRASVEQTSELSRPLLMDTLPAFYDNIAQATTASYPRTTAVEGSSLASEHGSERARLTKFDPQALVSEYQIFRWAIFDVLHDHQVPLTHGEIVAINASIDAGSREAITAFSLIHSTMREQFAAALTHDLRGPLQNANLALEVILMSTDPAKMKGMAVKAMDNLKRMDGMVHDLLDAMTAHAGTHMDLTLSHFGISEVVKEVQAQVPATHEARFQVTGGPVMGWWDREALKRAIENLVGNAIKYGDMQKPIRISFTEVNERLVLMVHNEGAPIPLDEQESVFQIFRRSQSAREGKAKGWGIGLPFVRNVAESHGGSVTLDSTLERGTTFTLDIPVDSRPFQDAPTFGKSL